MEVPADKQWGTVRENGTVTGMVGEVAKRRTHFAINEITITGTVQYTEKYEKDALLPYYLCQHFKNSN